jgi:hypothetical protein
MKKYLTSAALLLVAFFSLPIAAHAIPVTWDYTPGVLKPLTSAISAAVQGDHFNATNAAATSTFTGATTLATTTTSVLNGVIIVDGIHYPRTSGGIQSAIETCSSVTWCGNVYLPAGTYSVSTRMTPASNVHVYGAGKGVTVLQGGVVGDWDFYYSSTTLPVTNFQLSDMTIDLSNLANASGINLSGASSTDIDRVTFQNGAAGGWFIEYGPSSYIGTTTVNTNNRAVDDDFLQHSGSLEAVLVSNSQNMQIVRPYLTGVTSPGIGLWQADYGTSIDSLSCKDSSGSVVYYSITTDRTTLNNFALNNCGGITGANISDNGAFGLTQAQGLFINNPVMFGGPNTVNSSAIGLGAVNNAQITGGSISGYAIGINMTHGNNSASSSPTNWSIQGVKIFDNNPSGTVNLLHPGILFSSSLAGVQNGIIQDDAIYDDQGTATQQYPIVFDGAAAYDGVTIANNRLAAGPSGTSIAVGDGATLGSGVNIYKNTGFTGTNPAQNPIAISEGGTGTSTPPAANLLLLSDATGHYEYVATSSLGFSATNYWTPNGSAITNNNAGNVGVGSSSPAALLSLTGGKLSLDKNQALVLDGSNATAHSILYDGSAVRISDGGLTARFDSNGVGSRITLGADDISAKATINAAGTLNVGGTSSWIDNTPPTNGALIQGNVGIGTTTPAAALDVYASTASSTPLLLESVSGGGCEIIKDVAGTGYTQVYTMAGALFSKVHVGALSTCN